MDQKEIKSSLKEAKEAIKDKNIDKALNICKAILKADRENYLALVILGAALQESVTKEEAPKAYRRAIDICAEQSLAWQGLASYYEKTSNSNDQLLLIYKQLLTIEKQSSKKGEICKKIEYIITNVNETKNIEEFTSLLDDDDPDTKPLIEDILLKYFQHVKTVPDSLLHVYVNLLYNQFEKQDELARTACISKYLTALCRLKDYEKLLVEGRKLLDNDNISDKNILESLCRAYCELSVRKNPTCMQCDMEKYYDPLLKLDENSVYGLITKAIFLYDHADYVTCREVFYKACELDSRNWLIHYYLSKVHITLNCFIDAMGCILITRNLAPTDVHSTVKDDIEKCYLEVCSRSEDPDKCSGCYDRCRSLLSQEPSNSFIIKCWIRAAVTLSKWDSVEEALSKLSSSGSAAECTLLRALYFSRKSDVQQAIQILKKDIQDQSEYVEHWLLLGELYWKQRNVEDALASFLRAAKLAPHIYVAFMYLGHYYREVSLDMNKARRCYEKAFQLNPNCEEVGVALSDTYRVLKFTEKNFQLLSNAAAANVGKWAGLRLGLHHLDSGDAESAIQCLRSCIRLDPSDSYCWELLGDSCFARGSFTAALKCYQKCASLNSTSVYVSLQTAIVKQRIGLHDESILELRHFVEQNQAYIPALKGLAEVSLSYARELFDKQMLASARTLCEEAATALTRILQQKNAIMCIWKLLADACALVCHLPDKISYMKLPSFLVDEKVVKVTGSEPSTSVFCRDSLIGLALRCYQTAVNLGEGNKSVLSFLWHDIAYCYHLQANYATAEEDRVQQRKNAVFATRKSISLNSKSWQHWNLLGVIVSSKDINNVALAQHCFITAITLDKNNAMAWNNLGTLYLQHHDIQLANEVFQIAQKADPKYPRSWIGQALIAEMVGHDETPDLFYHTTVLGYHPESAKGFAEWICKILKNWDQYKDKSHCYYLVEKMYGLQVATDVLTWYTVHFPDDVAATNMLGVLLELCNLNRSAVSTCRHSLEQASTEQSDVIYSNLGRQLRKLGRHSEAIEACKQIKEADFVNQCELALSLFLDGQHEEALSGYEAAIHWLAPDDGHKAQVMVAMAALNYLSNMKPQAQTILLECTRLKTVPVYGLFAACAFGMLNKQLMLSKLVLKELETFKRSQEYIHHIALFNTYCEIFQGNFKSAISIISKFLYNHPGDASIWLSFCLLLLHLIFLSKEEYLRYSAVTAYQAKCAITLGRGVIDISKISSIVSLSYLLAGKGEESLRSSLKAVFLYPDVAENWAVLIAAHYSRGSDLHGLVKIIKHVRQELTCSNELLKWLVNMEKKVTTIIG